MGCEVATRSDEVVEQRMERTTEVVQVARSTEEEQGVQVTGMESSSNLHILLWELLVGAGGAFAII